MLRCGTFRIACTHAVASFLDPLSSLCRHMRLDLSNITKELAFEKFVVEVPHFRRTQQPKAVSVSAGCP